MITKKHLQGACILAFILLTFTPLLYVQEKKQKCLEKVLTRLEEKGYRESDISLIESKYHLAGLPNYWESVIFKNEPTIKYVYYCHQEGQMEYHSLDGKKFPSTN